MINYPNNMSFHLIDVTRMIHGNPIS